MNFEQENPKTPGSKASHTYDKYKTSTTIGEATQQGANWQDVSADFEQGWLTTPEFPSLVDMDTPSGAKRVHPEGSPHCEATNPAKVLAKEVGHRPQVETQKVEMNPATITALRMMLRDPNERRRCKVVSNMKTVLIEQDNHDPKDMVVNYKWFHVRLRDDLVFRSVAMVNDDGKNKWVDKNALVSANVKEAMADIEANLE